MGNGRTFRTAGTEPPATTAGRQHDQQPRESFRRARLRWAFRGRRHRSHDTAPHGRHPPHMPHPPHGLHPSHGQHPHAGLQPGGIPAHVAAKRTKTDTYGHRDRLRGRRVDRLLPRHPARGRRTRPADPRHHPAQPRRLGGTQHGPRSRAGKIHRFLRPGRRDGPASAGDGDPCDAHISRRPVLVPVPGNQRAGPAAALPLPAQQAPGPLARADTLTRASPCACTGTSRTNAATAGNADQRNPPLPHLPHKDRRVSPHAAAGGHGTVSRPDRRVSVGVRGETVGLRTGPRGLPGGPADRGRGTDLPDPRLGPAHRAHSRRAVLLPVAPRLAARHA